MTWFQLVTNDSSETVKIIKDILPDWPVSYGWSVTSSMDFLKCALPEDTIDVDLKVHTLKGIHMFRKDYKSQMT